MQEPYDKFEQKQSANHECALNWLNSPDEFAIKPDTILLDMAIGVKHGYRGQTYFYILSARMAIGVKHTFTFFPQDDVSESHRAVFRRWRSTHETCFAIFAHGGHNAPN